jgi:amphi-Trp domain-containing protein
MSDVEVTYKEPLTRERAAKCLSVLAAALDDQGEVELDLGATTMKVHVPGQVRCKIEVEIDRDEVELEVELTWSTSAPVRAVPTEEHAKRDSAGGPTTDAHPTGRRKVGAR